MTLLNASIFNAGSLGSLAKLQDECTGDHVLLKRTGENVRYCVISDIAAISELVSNKSDSVFCGSFYLKNQEQYCS